MITPEDNISNFSQLLVWSMYKSISSTTVGHTLQSKLKYGYYD